MRPILLLFLVLLAVQMAQANMRGERSGELRLRDLKEDDKDDEDDKDKDDEDDEDEDGGGLPDVPIEDIVDAACFSEVATAQVEGKGPVAMKDLQVGDKVLTASNEYQPVYAFGHYLPDTQAEFLQLVTDDSTLEMTGEHMVFVANKVNPVRADSIQIGDILLPAAKVIEINTVRRKGLYAPLTKAGNLVVEDIVASSYISLQKNPEFIQVDSVTTGMSQQRFAHIMLSPFRMMCLGISSSFCGNYNKQGMPQFIASGMELQHWAEGQNVVVQWIILAAAIVTAGVCMTLENTFGASLAPAAVATIVAAFAFFKATGLSVRANKCKTA